MHEITDPDDVTNPAMQNLLRLRFAQLAEHAVPLSDLGRFYLVRPGDDVSALLVNAVDGTPEEPSWEWVQDHGSFFEAVFIYDDSGFGHVYLIPDMDGVDPGLLTLCRRDATEPNDQS
ncbi:hypothetical protein [Sphingomonas yabuuchiae]|uniref:Uncharacterized protein n=1 Tax=Sphingomonas yabuuchiae TaxID=172044 RepID=A0AA40ZY26_9SPHN|nr:hypothetical protein [Sphingomonas yabuuchiae]MBB4609797.1 hypothetical protein [Sphingomonas yabuuchiae]MBN3558109.1 hypothetical protein [Sphingomonas yabuuchiae]